MRRRDFVSMCCAGLGASALRPATAWGSGRSSTSALPQEARYALPMPREVSGAGLELLARPGRVDIGGGASEAWLLNDSLPAPTIRLSRGSAARIDLVNELDEPTILHWHGLTVPELADGHPRLAIGPGERYAYRFDVRDRPGLYWYHPHTHGRTAPQTYLGMAGLIVIESEEEAELGLPSGPREIPLLLQDKRLSGGRTLSYEVGMGPDLMMGFLGDTPFGNGVARPRLEVDRAGYRLRILNGSNARIFDLGLDDGQPLTLIGTDGGLLESPVSVERLMLATGERADVLVDFSGHAEGDRIMLRSYAFEVPGMMGQMMAGMRGRMGRGRGGMMGMMGGGMQGTEMDLLELVVRGGRPEPLRRPSRLSTLPRREVSADTPTRTFRFESMMMRHTINGRSFELDRVDERVPAGRPEVWRLVNDSELPHPIHIHVGSFRVLGREGGRNRLMPWEAGMKDTVLVLPGERVDVGVRFEVEPGRFLLHCHNLEHEDAGMMLNFEVI